MDPASLAASAMYVPLDNPEVAKAWARLRASLERRASATVDQAFENVSAPAKAELDQLSESTREDLRLQLLESLDQGEREMWASVLAMQSSEKTSSKLVVATWGLVTATVGLVIATVVLVLVTVGQH